MKCFALASLLFVHRVTGADVVIDGSVLGPRFDGIGSLSGGGATSRLLIDYPAAVASDVLDFFFKPNYGASLHILKVEVGGGTFSGCGTEPSHMYNASDLSFERGYEWWLMREASARNPDILGYALPWGMPNWVGASDGGDPLNENLATYMTNFCLGAAGGAGGTWSCDYVGVWNERSYSISYVLQLRAALDAAGLNATQIVVNDQGWAPVPDILSNATFAESVAVIGVHYPGGSNSTPAAVSTGKPLWASEDSSTYFDPSGGGCMARIINWNYLYGNFTSLINWNLVSSYYERLYWYGDSLLGAAQPWSGFYEVMSPLWAMAHTTQFSQPGFRYLPQRNGGGGGGVGQLPGGGTFVTLVEDASPPSGAPLEWSIVVETMTTAHSQCIRSNPTHAWSVEAEQNVTFTLANGLATPPAVIVWKSVFFTGPGESSILWFERQADVAVNGDGVSYTLSFIHPDSVFTVTSLDRGQSHGTPSAPPPPPGAFPLPYADSFSGAGAVAEAMAPYFSDQAGSFAHMPRRDGAAGLALEQVVVAPAVAWGGDSLYPLTLVGDWNTSDVDVSVRAFIYSPATYGPPGGGSDPIVSLAPCAAGDPSQSWFFNASAGVALPGSLVDGRLGQCLDVFGCDSAPGTPLWMWPCVSAPQPNCASANQLWDYNASALSLVSRMANGFCATATLANGSYALASAPCAGGGGQQVQQFVYESSTGALRAAQSDPPLCLSSAPPTSGNASDDTHAGIGLRLGGMLPSSSVAQAYADTFFNYGYFFSVRPDGSWAVYAGTSAPRDDVPQRSRRRREAGAAAAEGGRTVLASGVLPAPMGLQQWHTLRFVAKGAALSAYFDGALVAQVQDATFPVGWMGLTSGWSITQFANFSASTPV